MQSRLLAITPWISLTLATFVACGGGSTGTMVIGGSGSSSGTMASTSGTVAGTGTAANSGTSGTVGSGSVAGTGGTGTGVGGTGTGTGGSGVGGTGTGTGGSGTGVGGTGTGTGGSGATSGVASSGGVASGSSGTGGSGASSGTGTGMLHPPKPSTGCGKPLPAGLAQGQWVSQPAGCAQGNGNQGTAQCQLIPGIAGNANENTVPAKSSEGTAEYRGWWVYVPNGYDPNKPYRVIYNGAGCGDGNYFHAGADGYPYNSVDGGNAILVGLDYDTFSDVLGCYDNRNADSNDFRFFPWLQNQIETEFCVDTNHEFFSGYSSGGWVMQQFNCAFPDKLRGSVAVTGCEPGVKPYPGGQFSPCVNKPTAAFYVKDFGDQDNTYACILPACTRVLNQNGCSTTVCNPLDATTTVPYALPASITPPAGTKCVQFKGCPTDYPVVFCVTYNQDHSDAQNWGVVALFWDWMSNKLAD